MDSTQNYPRKIPEGHSGLNPGQTLLLSELARKCQNVLEIGFNAGHSADAFLSSNLSLRLVSVDIGVHDYVRAAANAIAAKFPQRHQLFIGDSTVILPELSKSIDTKFDLIFIDGGHDYKTAKADLHNCKSFAHSSTIVLVDDVIVGCLPMAKWNIGPNQAWFEAVMDGVIQPIGYKMFRPGSGCVWGAYQSRVTS